MRPLVPPSLPPSPLLHRGILARFLPRRFRPKPGSAAVPLTDLLIASAITAIAHFHVEWAKKLSPAAGSSWEEIQALHDGIPLIYSSIVVSYWIAGVLPVCIIWILCFLGLRSFCKSEESPAALFALALTAAAIPTGAASDYMNPGLSPDHYSYWHTLIVKPFIWLLPVLFVFWMNRRIEKKGNGLRFGNILLLAANSIPLALLLAPGTLVLAAATGTAHAKTSKGRRIGIALACGAAVLAVAMEHLQGHFQAIMEIFLEGFDEGYAEGLERLSPEPQAPSGSTPPLKDAHRMPIQPALEP